jgi:integrase
MAFSPSFLYRNHCGIFCFQRRVPDLYRRQNPKLPKFFRKSLGTRSRGEALSQARKLSVMLDELQKRYFRSEEWFAEAIQLLQRYEKASSEYPDWTAFEENFLCTLDDVTGSDSALLQRAFDYVNAKRLAAGESPYGDPTARVVQIDQGLVAQLVSQLSAAGLVSHKRTNSKTLEAAMEEYCVVRRERWKSDSGMEEGFREEVFPLFLEATTTRDTAELSKADVNAYVRAVLALPNNRRKKRQYKHLTLDEILGMNIPDEDKLSPTTKRGYLARLRAFIGWMEERDYCPNGITAPMSKVIAPRSIRASEAKEPYTNDDLGKLFNNADYTRGLHKEPSRYWVPLFLLLSGARANEICQLFVKDIRQDEATGFWVLDINENDRETTLKSLKKPYHKRLFPIPPIILKLGFLDFVEDLRKKQVARVFPELPYKGTQNKYGDRLERWFNNTYTNKRNCNITTPRTSLHSLRHNTTNYLRHVLKAQESDYAHAVGQTPAGGVSTKVYTKPADLKSIEALFKKVKFEGAIDFNSIKPYKEQAFYKNELPGRKKTVRPRKTKQEA